MNALSLWLSQADVFNKLPRSECYDLAKMATCCRLGKGEFLCYQGSIWPNVVFITVGELRWVILSPGGKEFVPFAWGPGTVFWSHSLFDDLPMPASLRSSQPSEIYWWPREVVLPVLYRNPLAMWEITRTLVRVMRQSREIIHGLAFKPVAGRLAKLLLDHYSGQRETFLERDLTLREMADMTATRPEVVSRVLHEFRERGILQLTRESIIICDAMLLKELSNRA